MTTETTPGENVEPENSEIGTNSQQPSDNIANNMPSSNKEVASRQPTDNSSPSKQQSGNEMSPSKSRNKRKNDARRRNGNHKKTSSTKNETQSETSPPQPTIPQTQSSSSSSHPNQEVVTSTVSNDTKAIVVNEVQSSDNKQEKSTTNSIGLDNKSTSNRQSKPKQTNNSGVRDNSADYKQLKEQLKIQNNQIGSLVDQVKQQICKIGELEKALVRTNKTCNQLEKLLEQEILSKNGLEAENSSLNQTNARLKKQLAIHEKNKFNNDELVRVLNATLMERETEISILKLKLTRLQTNPSSVKILNSNTSISSVKQEQGQNSFTLSGRSNSEFDRNSYIRSSLIAEAASVRASATHLKSDDQDASVWATVPEELTPSKRPAILDKSLQPVYGQTLYGNLYGSSPANQESSTLAPFERDRRYKTLPYSIKSPSQGTNDNISAKPNQPVEDSSAETKTNTPINQHAECRITNLDDSNSTSQSSGNRTINSYLNNENRQPACLNDVGLPLPNSNQNHVVKTSAIPEHSTNDRIAASLKGSVNTIDESHYSVITKNDPASSTVLPLDTSFIPPRLPERTSTTPVKFSNKMKKLFVKFRRSDSTTNSHSKTDLYDTSTPKSSPFKRGANRSTMLASPNDIQAQMSQTRQVMSFQTDKPFAEWDTTMLCDWLTIIGLSMYSTQCRRWVECGANIMDATPAEVDKGLGITNHLHRKKLRLAISELNGDCDKITKAAAKLDYLWVARWLDDIGLPQYKENFINARVDGRVLNYLTVEDLISMGVKSVLHHASIRCGIKVLRSIQFDLQLLKRRATSEEIEQMNTMRKNMNHVGESSHIRSPRISKGDTDSEVSLWTCHRVMEWLRLIDFAEFAPNLRGSGVHGGLIVYEDGFNIDTICSLLSIPNSRTLLRRHLSTFFKDLIGEEAVGRKRRYQDLPSNQQLNPSAEVKSSKRSQLWFSKLKHPKVGQDVNDEYLCPMYPVEPQLIRTQKKESFSDDSRGNQLAKIPESINI